MDIKFKVLNIGCFFIAILLAYFEKWKLNQFCWIIWISGLVFSYLCIIAGLIHFFIDYRNQRTKLLFFFPLLDAFKNSLVFIILVMFISISSVIAFFIYTYLYVFYGIFLSVFARMEPLNYFGENGFINSNFYGPMFYLLVKYWQIVLLTTFSNFFMIIKVEPLNKIIAPFKSKEIFRIHFMIFILPIFSLLFFVIFREKYEFPAIVVLLFAFYLTNSYSTKKNN